MSVLSPTTEAEVVDAVLGASTQRTPLEVVGGGTRTALGRPVQAEHTLSTAALGGISLYEPGALTLVARAGTPMADINAALAAEGQMLPFEPVDHRALLGTDGEPTIGGAVAVAASGPRRVQKGAIRDAMIGVRFVDGAGRAIANGGRVMKNVTGYDIVKLMAGQYGTLGVLTEIAFKLLPAPRATAVLMIAGQTPTHAVDAMSAALGSPYDVAGAAHLPMGLDGDALTMIRVEGLEASVDYRAKALKTLLAPFGDITVETDADRTAAAWRHVRDAERFAGSEGAVWRISVRPSDGPRITERLRTKGLECGAFYDWGGGLVWLKVPETDNAGADLIRAETASLGGHATLIRASAAIRAGVDVFEPEPEPLARISAGLRAKFDPMGILNPGRMRA